MTALLVSACGGSSSTPGSSSSGGGGGASATPIVGPNGGNGGDFCGNVASFITQFRQATTGLFNNISPGATPDVNGIKSLYQSIASEIDSLDGQAPSEIAADFHTLRTAFDQANTKVQSVTTFQQFDQAVAPLDTSQVQTADKHVQDYMQNTCHITPEPSTTP